MTTPTMEKIKVMLAFDEGKQIECKNKEDFKDKWSFLVSPIWNWHKFDYRIAPPAPRKFTRWFIDPFNGSLYGPYSDKAYAKSAQYLYGKSEVVAFEMTEILDAS